MKTILASIFCFFILANCSKVKTASEIDAPTNQSKTISASPTVEKKVVPAEEIAPLKSVVPSVKLNSEQKDYLNESLPPKVRKFLENAENVTILAEMWNNVEDDNEWTVFEPNRIAKITKEDNKREILESLYFDASRPTALSACFYPRHEIQAVHQGKKVKVEICYTCSVFIVEGDLGHFEGTITRESGKSENVLNRLIESQGVTIK